MLVYVIVFFILFQFIIINGLISHKPLSLDSSKFPWWSDWLGWTMAGSSMLFIPSVALYKICSAKGSLREVSAFGQEWKLYTQFTFILKNEFLLLKCAILMNNRRGEREEGRGGEGVRDRRIQKRKWNRKREYQSRLLTSIQHRYAGYWDRF